MTSRRLLLMFPLAALASSGLATVALAAPSVKQKELAARKAFGGGDWAKALDLYSDLFAETLHATYLRNIGRCHQKLGNADKAISVFRDYLAKAKDLKAEERQEIEGYIKEMEAMKEAAAPKPAPNPAPTPAPAVTAPAKAPAPAQPAWAPAPTPAATAVPSEPSEPVYKKWWFWGALGAAVAGGVAAVLLTRKTSASDAACPVEVCK